MNFPEYIMGHEAVIRLGFFLGIFGKPSSTLGFEKHWNPALSMSKNEFVAYSTREIPPRPAEMDRMAAANLGA